MARWRPGRKTAALEALAAEVFGELRFDAFKTDMGIVGTRWKEERPIIFKTNRRQAFQGKATFEPGFGCTIADAVVGSCSAYPFFKKKLVTTSRGEKIEVRDGGFVANNPTLYAIVDATESLGSAREDVRVVSIGVGEYPPPKLPTWSASEMVEQAADHGFSRRRQWRSVRSPWTNCARCCFVKLRPSASTPGTRSQRWQRTCSRSTWTNSDMLWQRGRDCARDAEIDLRKFLT